jgi:hypothetical protein
MTLSKSAPGPTGPEARVSKRRTLSHQPLTRKLLAAAAQALSRQAADAVHVLRLRSDPHRTSRTIHFVSAVLTGRGTNV